jgi:hypothetical protein
MFEGGGERTLTRAFWKSNALLQPPKAIMLCFFNLAGAVYDPDVEGFEVATIDQARVLAAKHVAEVISDRPEIVWAGEEVRLEVTDERQLVLFTIMVVGVDAASAAGQPSSFRPKS